MQCKCPNSKVLPRLEDEGNMTQHLSASPWKNGKKKKTPLPDAIIWVPRDALDSGNLAKAGHTLAFPSGNPFRQKASRVERLEDVKSLRWMVKGGEMAGGSKVSRFGWGGFVGDIRRRRLFFWEDGDDGDFFVSKLLKGAFYI